MRLIVSESARRDLESIAHYTEREWGARQKARYLEEIEGRMRALRDNPALGAPRDDLRPGCRSLVVVSHVIYYRTAEEAVEVLRVLHHSMDVGGRLSLEAEPEA